MSYTGFVHVCLTRAATDIPIKVILHHLSSWGWILLKKTAAITKNIVDKLSNLLCKKLIADY